jgi:hypothetical protein
MNYTTIFVGLAAGFGGIALGWNLAMSKLNREYQNRYSRMEAEYEDLKRKHDEVQTHIEDISKQYEENLDAGLRTVRGMSYTVIPERENEDPDDEIDFFDDGAPEEQEGAESDEDENGELKEPFVITKEMFDHDYAYCDSEEMHWYPNDCTLADFNNEVVPNPYDILGDQGMAELDANSNTTGKDIIYVHNDSMDVNYEVVIHHHEYFND